MRRYCFQNKKGEFSIKVQNMDIVDFDPHAPVVNDEEWGMA